MSLRLIKGRIATIESTQKLTIAMRMIATAKLSTLQLQLPGMLYYLEALKKCLGIALSGTDDLPILCTQQKGPSCLVFYSCDQGLCGGFHSNSLKKLIHHMHEHSYDHLIIIGKKGKNIYLKDDRLIHECHTIKDIYDYALKELPSRMDVLHYQFSSLFKMPIVVTPLLPLIFEKPPFFNGIIEITPQLKEDLSEKVLFHTLKTMFASHQACEYAQRMQAMDNATTNSKEMIKKLKRTYNRTRQSVITRELIEIISGIPQ